MNKPRLPLALAALAATLLLSSCTMPDPAALVAANEPLLAEAGIKALPVGEPFPAFAATSAAGEAVELPVSGSKTVLLVFIAPDTPNSAANLLALSAAQAELSAAGIKALGLTVADPQRLEAFAARYGITVPLVPDGGKLARQLGVLAADGEYPQRTLIGIDEEGRVAFYERRFLPPATILELFSS